GITRDDIEFVYQGGADLTIAIKGTDDTLVIRNWFASYRYKLDNLTFADGTVMTLAQMEAQGYVVHGTEGDDATLIGTGLNDVIMGNAGNDVLNGNYGNDTLLGGEGNDSLYGGNGSDVLDGGAGNDYLQGDGDNNTYRFGRGSGQDTISLDDGYESQGHTVAFGEGITRDDIEFVCQGGADLTIAIKGTDDTLVIRNWFASYRYKLDNLTFADGTMMTLAQMEAQGYYTGVAGTLGDDTLSGSGTKDYMEGYAGNDVISGNGGDDILQGGEGNDTLNGGSGNDTYLFGTDSGSDTISDYDTTVNTDAVEFAVNPLDIIFSQSGDSLTIDINGLADQVSVQNWYSGSANQVEEIQAADGSVLMSNEVDLLVQEMAGFCSQNGITWEQAVQQKPTEVQAILSHYWSPQAA
ncbi:MAG: calcium-binding protein, partial [Thermodesulfovibrionales bacterium]